MQSLSVWFRASSSGLNASITPSPTARRAFAFSRVLARTWFNKTTINAIAKADNDKLPISINCSYSNFLIPLPSQTERSPSLGSRE
jgi:hypothetical protein